MDMRVTDLHLGPRGDQRRSINNENENNGENGEFEHAIHRSPSWGVWREDPVEAYWPSVSGSVASPPNKV